MAISSAWPVAPVFLPIGPQGEGTQSRATGSWWSLEAESSPVAMTTVPTGPAVPVTAGESQLLGHCAARVTPVHVLGLLGLTQWPWVNIPTPPNSPRRRGARGCWAGTSSWDMGVGEAPPPISHPHPEGALVRSGVGAKVIMGQCF